MPDSIAHITHQASTAPAAVTGRTPSPRTVKKPLRAPAQADSIAREKAIADSTAYADSVSAASKLTKAIVVTDPSAPYADAPPKGMDTASWVIAAMALLFCLVGLRYRGNARFLKGMLRQAVELRERNNMFDETVRESLFTLLVTLLTAGSLGLLLYQLCILQGYARPGGSYMGVCIGCTVSYTLLLPVFQLIFGSIFAGKQLAMEWIKGFSAGMGLLAIPVFPLALAAICHEPFADFAMIAGAVCFAVVKLLYIYRGFRIFMTESSSWVVFLYYLCNLEIVPIIMTYVGACGLCALIS